MNIKEHNVRICSGTNSISECNLIDITQLKNEKSFEFIYLKFFITFMSTFYDEDRFQARLLKDDTINGMAISLNGTYYSCINTGTIAKTYESAKNLASKMEKYKDKENVAWLICYFSVVSTVFHEAGHILDGHIDYMNIMFGENELLCYEDDVAKTDLNYCKTRKTIEQDADEFSASRIADIGFLNYEGFKEIYPHIISSHEDLIQFMILGIANKFFQYGIEEYKYNRIYLPSGYRIVLICDALYNHYFEEKISEITRNTFQEIFNSSVGMVLGSDKGIVGKFLEQIYIGFQESEQLKIVWNEIYEQLNKRKHSKVTLSPKYDIQF